MMPRRRRFLAALTALAAMAFAQAAYALAACDPTGAPSRAQMIVAQQAEPAPCHAPADNATLCLAHCQAGEQTLDKHQVKVPDASCGAVLRVQAWPDTHSPVRYIQRVPSPAAGPPPRILFQTLLI
jgi:hypothetical protein